MLERTNESYELNGKDRIAELARWCVEVGFWLCLADEVRGGEEALGAPERVVEVGAVGLQLRRQPAVHHQPPAVFMLCIYGFHVFMFVTCNSYDLVVCILDRGHARMLHC